MSGLDPQLKKAATAQLVYSGVKYAMGDTTMDPRCLIFGAGVYFTSTAMSFLSRIPAPVGPFLGGSTNVVAGLAAVVAVAAENSNTAEGFLNLLVPRSMDAAAAQLKVAAIGAGSAMAADYVGAGFAMN